MAALDNSNLGSNLDLCDKSVLVLVTGGIAAYKSVDLVSQLKKLGANVKVVLSQSATRFVSPYSLEIISGHKTYVGIEDFEKQEEQNLDPDLSLVKHIELANWADLVLVAPATANAIAKMANGLSGEMLYDIMLATKAPIMIAPAMNTNMWEHPSTKQNLNTLESFGYKFIEPGSGLLACGAQGTGRLADIETITDSVLQHFNSSSSAGNNLLGKHFVVTLGATRESLDPIRFFSNRSSGKMGLALASEAVKMGANISLISTIDIDEPWINNSRIKVTKVETADQMLAATRNEFISSSADALFMVAAVSDFRPKHYNPHKIKKADIYNQEGKNDSNVITETYAIEMEKNTDILREMGEQKTIEQKLIGFSVETDNAIHNAKSKLKDKNLDFIVVNSPAAFGSDEADVVILDGKSDESYSVGSSSKQEIAQKMLGLMVNN